MNSIAERAFAFAQYYAFSSFEKTEFRPSIIWIDLAPEKINFAQEEE
jgi:hypothetical protein